MKSFFIILLISFYGSAASAQQDKNLSATIDSLYAVDQQVQQKMLDAFQNNASKETIDSLERDKESAFKRHVPLLKKIIRENGLPTYQLVGKESSDHFITMVNHSFADIKFQQQVIRLSMKEISSKNITASSVAMMDDKMRIKSNRQQLYGTQMEYDAKGNAIAANLYHPSTVDIRRKKMGLGLLKEYLDGMTELHRQMNEKK